MKLEIEDDDVVIRRATNGWIAYKVSLFEPEHLVTLVYEDDGSPMGEAEAFARMIREVFPDMVQSKKRGGVSLEVKECGYADDSENTTERLAKEISEMPDEEFSRNVKKICFKPLQTGDGGNTPERIDEQIEWLESITEPEKK